MSREDPALNGFWFASCTALINDIAWSGVKLKRTTIPCCPSCVISRVNCLTSSLLLTSIIPPYFRHTSQSRSHNVLRTTLRIPACMVSCTWASSSSSYPPHDSGEAVHLSHPATHNQHRSCPILRHHQSVHSLLPAWIFP